MGEAQTAQIYLEQRVNARMPVDESAVGLMPGSSAALDCQVLDISAAGACVCIQNADIIGFVVASNCQYKSPASYPEPLTAGLRVNKLGNSSVEYGIGIFKEGAEQASAMGTFTHVFVDRTTDKSVPIPSELRVALEALAIKE